MAHRQETIRCFLCDWLAARAAATGHSDVGTIGDDIDLFNSWLLDSIGFVALVAAIEKEFGIEMDLSEVDPERFSTVGGLTGVVSMFLPPEVR